MIAVACAITLIVAHLCYLEFELLLYTLVCSRTRAIARSEKIFYASSRKILAIIQLMLRVRIICAWPQQPIPAGSIIISNHQSYFDILLIRLFCRQQRIRFIAKQTLARGFPAVSRLMRLQRHAFINRTHDLFTTMQEIRNFARAIAATALSPVIFAEGTCATDGILLPFLSAGMRQLATHIPRPIAAIIISNSYRLNNIMQGKRPDNSKPVRIALLKQIENPAERRAVLRHIDTLEQEYRAELRRWQ